MVVPVCLNEDTTGSAMIDSGASTQFIDIDFVVKTNQPPTLKPKPETLIVIDGRETKSQLTNACTFYPTVDQYLETLTSKLPNVYAGI